MSLEKVEYNGWKNSVRLANKEVELIVTTDVGPRIIRFGFIGKRNVLGEIPAQLGGCGEKDWMIRGGHRLWVAPEEKPKSYEQDNVPIIATSIPGGVRTVQKAGPITHVEKSMEIKLSPRKNEVTVSHILTNRGRKPITLAPWALTVMTLKGTAVIPLPGKISHSARLTHNQQWSIWGYTDFSDPRWTLGSKYVLFRQDPARGPNKLGIAHREGWAAYLVDTFAFIKRFNYVEGACYPDGGMNFETFSNEDILELESLGPLVKLAPGKSVTHVEKWSLHKGVPRCSTEAAIDRHLLPLV